MITIEWSPPAAIEHGTPLSAAQLNASCPDTLVTPGGWVYDPPRGAILRVGTHTLSADHDLHS
jgi:hypothetical protein